MSRFQHSQNYGVPPNAHPPHVNANSSNVINRQAGNTNKYEKAPPVSRLSNSTISFLFMLTSVRTVMEMHKKSGFSKSRKQHLCIFVCIHISLSQFILLPHSHIYCVHSYLIVCGVCFCFILLFFFSYN